MNDATENRVVVYRTRTELESLRDFWSSCALCRDADLDFFLFIAELFPEVERPHVVVLYQGNVPKALLAARLETRRVPVKLGYFSLPAPKLRILQVVHGGWLGDMSGPSAKLLVGSIIDTLVVGEADAASWHSVDIHSPLARCVRELPPRLWADRQFSPQMRRVRDLSGPARSRNWRYQQRRRQRDLAQAFGEVRIEHFAMPTDIDRLMRDAETVATKSYQRGLGVGFAPTQIVRARLQFEASKGWLRGYILYLDERPCAFWIASLRNQVFLSEYLAFDADHAQFSPGMYLILHVIEELQGEASDLPARLVDFGIGDASYKERLASHSTEEATLYMFAPRLKPLWVNTLRTSLGMINGTVKRLLRRTRWLADVKRWWRSRLSHTGANVP